MGDKREARELRREIRHLQHVLDRLRHHPHTMPLIHNGRKARR